MPTRARVGQLSQHERHIHTFQSQRCDGGSNEDTFTNNSVSLSTVETKNDKVGEVNTSENNRDISDNSNGVSSNAKQAAVDKVSNNDISNNELTSNSQIKSDNGVIIKNVVNNNSGDEVLVEIESSNKVVGDERLGWAKGKFSQLFKWRKDSISEL